MNHFEALEEFPAAASEAVRLSDSMLCPTTQIQDASVAQPAGGLAAAAGLGAAAAPVAASQPMAPMPTEPMVGMLAQAAQKFGLEDDEI